jgi:8-oxo-dGTP pyrophosphatase MutT (NUDIX family)
VSTGSGPEAAPRSPAVDPDAAPDWLAPLVAAAARLDPSHFGAQRIPPPPDDARQNDAGQNDAGQNEDRKDAAVLVLFGHGSRGPDVLLIERASGLRHHAGQVAFPGGSTDPGDADHVATALREAAEETGVDPAGARPVAVLPQLFVPPTGFRVTPVLAHWFEPVAVAPGDPGETAAVIRVPLSELADPANRFCVRSPSGYIGPAFEVASLVVWGFTGGLLSALLNLGGWERQWDSEIVRDLETAWSMARGRSGAGRQEVAR